MKYPASEKLEIIRLFEHSRLSVRRTLDKIGVSRSTFYRWCDLYQRFGEEGLEDKRVGPTRAWNRIPDKVRDDVLDMALCRPELSPRGLAVTYTDERSYFLSETGVWMLIGQRFERLVILRCKDALTKREADTRYVVRRSPQKMSSKIFAASFC